MPILIDDRTRVLVQNITGRQGMFHTGQMLECGTKVVAGVAPGKGGQKVEGVPVFDSIEEAVKMKKATASIIFVPAPFALDAAFEAITASLDPIVIITEHIPVHDSIKIVEYARQNDVHIVGPNTPGLMSPGMCKMGIMPNHIFSCGKIGVVSRSGTLTYEIASSLTQSGLGQSTAVGLGGDPVVGLSFTDVLAMFERDGQTKGIAMIGEIGGNAEERAAEFIRKNVKKPVVAYIAGRTAPSGKTMGHAGAVISGTSGTAQSKIEALKKAGVSTAELPGDVADILMKKLRSKRL